MAPTARQNTMALAAVTALLLGCRASEVLQLRVRDLPSSSAAIVSAV